MCSPDYENVNKDIALKDFLLRIEHYEEKYHPLDEDLEKEISFMKIYNTGEKVVVHKHEGHIQSRIVYYLMNIHITPRTIYLTRVRIFIIYKYGMAFNAIFIPFFKNIFSMVKVNITFVVSLVAILI